MAGPRATTKPPDGLPRVAPRANAGGQDTGPEQTGETDGGRCVSGNPARDRRAPHDLVNDLVNELVSRPATSRPGAVVGHEAGLAGPVGHEAGLAGLVGHEAVAGRELATVPGREAAPVPGHDAAAVAGHEPANDAPAVDLDFAFRSDLDRALTWYRDELALRRLVGILALPALLALAGFGMLTEPGAVPWLVAALAFLAAAEIVWTTTHLRRRRRTDRPGSPPTPPAPT